MIILWEDRLVHSLQYITEKGSALLYQHIRVPQIDLKIESILMNSL